MSRRIRNRQGRKGEATVYRVAVACPVGDVMGTVCEEHDRTWLEGDGLRWHDGALWARCDRCQRGPWTVDAQRIRQVLEDMSAAATMTTTLTVTDTGTV